LEWNRRINLISRQDTSRIVGYHFVDSLTANPLIPPGSAVCDWGAGAGLPGIPLRIVRADITLTLLESIRKKALFLDEAVRRLGLANTVVLNQRGEATRREATRREELTTPRFDVICCRLIGRISEVLPAVVCRLTPGGRVIFYKGRAADSEISEAQPVMSRLHVSVLEVRDCHFLRPVAFDRRLVVVG
jgi:16S rRNA (guanine527-N7)-methyltransferase